MRKKICCIMAAMFLFCFAVLFAGCAKDVDDFTEEEHIQRITERVQESGLMKSGEYTGFSVYPLYDQNDEFFYFLVEFEPYAFMFIRPRDELSAVYSWFGIPSGMYMICLYGNQRMWSPYTIDETNSQPGEDKDICWILDANGEKINYNRSPYYVTGNIDQRKYLFDAEQGSGSEEFICAVKTGDTYLNLVSLEEMSIEDGDLLKKQMI